MREHRQLSVSLIQGEFVLAIVARNRVRRRILLLDWFRSGGLLGDPLEGTLDRWRDGRRCGNVSAGHLGAELVGGPAHGDGGAVRCVVLHGTLDKLCLIRGAGVLATADLTLQYTALRLVSKRIVPASVAEIARVAHDLLRLLEVWVLTVDQSKQRYQ